MQPRTRSLFSCTDKKIDEKKLSTGASFANHLLYSPIKRTTRYRSYKSAFVTGSYTMIAHFAMVEKFQALRSELNIVCEITTRRNLFERSELFRLGLNNYNIL